MAEEDHGPPGQRCDGVPQRAACQKAHDVSPAKERKSQGDPRDRRQQQQGEIAESVCAAEDSNRGQYRRGERDGNGN